MSIIEADFGTKVQLLAPSGELVDGASVPEGLDEEDLIEMFRAMRLGRHFDKRAVSLQRQGRMGTFAPLAGQEGAQVGSAFAMDEEDWLFPSYREHVAAVLHGLPLEKTLAYWMGREEGNAIPDDANVFPVTVPIGTQLPHATGAAWAAKLQGDSRAFVVHFGDGATSEGDFHEGLNFAGVFDAPVVFFCNNNQWAISVPRERQTASNTIAQKAHAYGFEGIQVDGMDPLAVYQVTRDAIEKAKDPASDQRRPTLIEAVQYRFGPHTTADDPSAYRDEEEVERWKERDPLVRFEEFLRDRGLLDDAKIDAIDEEVEQRVADAIEAAEAYPEPDPAAIFEYVYEDIPPELATQLKHFEQLRDQVGDEAFQED